MEVIIIFYKDLCDNKISTLIKVISAIIYFFSCIWLKLKSMA